jgi:ribulose-phosphate 3-epimerase
LSPTAIIAPRLSVGVLTADLARLAEELQVLHGKDVWAHVDLMDGQFCPALTVGAPLVRAVASCGVPVDAHLMVQEPRRMLAEVYDAGATTITVHAESTRHLHRTLQELTDLAASGTGLLRGLALNPGTPIAVVEPVIDLIDLVLVLAVSPGWSGQTPAVNTAGRVEQVRALADRLGAKIQVGVDGGVTLTNAATVASWGADMVVSGSAIYDGHDPATNLTEMLQILTGEPA